MKQTLRDETYKRLCRLVRSRPELKVMILKTRAPHLNCKMKRSPLEKDHFLHTLNFPYTHTHTHTHPPLCLGVACVIFIILISYLGWLGWNILCNKGSFLFRVIFFPECIPWDTMFSIFLRWGWGGGLTFREMSYKVASLCLFRHLKDVLEQLRKVTLSNWQQEDQTKDK